MGAWVVPPVAGLIEPAVAPEFYIEGIGAIERIGSNVRIYCYAKQSALDTSGDEYKTVVIKIVRPADATVGFASRILKILAPTDEDEPARPAPGSKPHLVT